MQADQKFPNAGPDADHSPDAGKMVEPDAISEEAMGMNPDYKPPIMRWNTVEVFAPEGFSFGIITDTSGLLSLAIRPPGGDWPDDFKPMQQTIHTIAEGDRAYCVVNDERMEGDGQPPNGEPAVKDSLTTQPAPDPTLLEAAERYVAFDSIENFRALKAAVELAKGGG